MLAAVPEGWTAELVTNRVTQQQQASLEKLNLKSGEVLQNDRVRLPIDAVSPLINWPICCWTRAQDHREGVRAPEGPDLRNGWATLEALE